MAALVDHYSNHVSSLALESQEHQLPCHIYSGISPKLKLGTDLISSHSDTGKVTGNKYKCVVYQVCV